MKEIPKTLYCNGHIYNYIEQCNDTLYLYEESKHKYKTTFSNHDLGLIEPIKLKSTGHRNSF